MCKLRFYFIIYFLFQLCVSSAQPLSEAYLTYIDKYRKVAVEQMRKYNIPASITLAQGLLESDAGRSMLAVEGNNHFGIKCHNDWNGRTMYYDDDRQGECFRRYGSAQLSFEDHSLFLTGKSRYASLFNLRPTDYKGWARGLKAAGYATNPQYAEKLINIIELYDLNRFDRTIRDGDGIQGVAAYESSPDSKDRKSVRDYYTELTTHQPYISNGLLYVYLGDDETLKDIAHEFRTTAARLRNVNEIKNRYVPEPGSIIYLEKKKCKAAAGFELHTVGPDDSLWSISQLYGVRLKCLLRKNRMDMGDSLAVGMELRLR